MQFSTCKRAVTRSLYLASKVKGGTEPLLSLSSYPTLKYLVNRYRTNLSQFNRLSQKSEFQQNYSFSFRSSVSVPLNRRPKRDPLYYLIVQLPREDQEKEQNRTHRYLPLRDSPSPAFPLWHPTRWSSRDSPFRFPLVNERRTPNNSWIRR